MPTTLDLREPLHRYCTLLTVSGRHPDEDARCLRGLRSMFNLDPYPQRPLTLFARERGRPRPAEHQLIQDALPATAAAILASLVSAQ